MSRRVPKGREGQHGSVNYRAYFTTRNGRRVYARDYGYKSWPIGQ